MTAVEEYRRAQAARIAGAGPSAFAATDLEYKADAALAELEAELELRDLHIKVLGGSLETMTASARDNGDAAMHDLARAEQAEAALAQMARQKTGLASAAKRGLSAVARAEKAEAALAEARPLIDRAQANVQKWGTQDVETLCLAIAEECGELAQAVLQARHEKGDPARIREEAIDLGALTLQVLAHPNANAAIWPLQGDETTMRGVAS